MQDFTGSLWTNRHILATVDGKIELTTGPDGMVTCKGKFRQTLSITASVGANYRLTIRGEPALDIVVTNRSNGGPLQETWFDFEGTARAGTP
jgi:hypothetical protein